MRRGCFQIGILSCLFLPLAGSLRSAPPADQKTPAKNNTGGAASSAGTVEAEYHITIKDDPAERDAFAAMINETDQRRRRDMAARFLAEYPLSWRLAPVYEVASKSSFALGDLREALEFGAKSLRILPENPFLLLPLADAQTRAGLYDAAARSARDAIWYLDRFDHPTSIDENSWRQIKARNQAEGYFDIGRVAAAEGLANSGDLRARQLADAETALLRALSFNAGGAGIPNLLGTVYLGEGRPDEAAAIFAVAARSDSPARGGGGG
jgi:tetratricopeptide (TPR) repeat protein